MFSVIICSIHPGLLEQIKTNLAETIGSPYELLVWDNRAEQKGLCEVYNLMASRATQPLCCFIHEDILFQTLGWGSLLAKAFDADPSVGLIGVAGPIYKSKTPSGWSSGLTAIDRANIFHRDPEGRSIHILQNPSRAATEPVVCVDGVFLCTPTHVWRQKRFDEEMLKGFHLYDLDFSFRVAATHRVLVHYGIDIMHLTTGGNFGDEWVVTTLDWHRRCAPQLPASLLKTGQNGKPESEIRKKCLHRLRNEKISAGNKWRWIRESGALSDPGCWPFVYIFLFPGIYNRLRRKR